MKRNFLYLLFCITISTVSCKKSFLTLDPQSAGNAADFYKTTSDLTNAVTAAYASLQGSSMYLSNFFEMMELRSDNIEDQNPGADAGRHFNIDRFLAGADNTVFSDSWLALYNAISRCNNALAHLDVVTDTRLKHQYEGELRFLRALHYFNLVRLWGDVPLILQPTTIQDAQNIGRSPVAHVYAAIEEDLIQASSLLSASYSSTDLGRATSVAAKGLLGKVYLTQKKYIQAANILNELVIAGANTNTYYLLPNVADVFSVSNKLNAEVLFAVHFEKTIAGQGHNVPVYINQPIIDPNLLNAYEPADMRRDLLNIKKLDDNISPIKKYFDTFDPTNRTVGFDLIILRYSDVLLMLAESLNEINYNSNPDSDNFKYLNMVRSRARASLFTPERLNSQQTFRNAVLQERRLELPFEFSRWFDLIRTNSAADALQKSALTMLMVQPYQYLYPVPQGQIEVIHNPGIFPQNPGY